MVDCFLGVKRDVNMGSFSREDVIALAKAILEDPLKFTDYCYDSYYWCKYCGERSNGQPPSTRIVHALDCPVLIAQDVMTRHKEIKVKETPFRSSSLVNVTDDMVRVELELRRVDWKIIKRKLRKYYGGDLNSGRSNSISIRQSYVQENL